MLKRTLVVVCLVAASTAAALAQQTITKGEKITASATIQAIDQTSRTVTLRKDNGEEDTFAVDPEVKRFNELKVGDKVSVSYYESLVLQVRKPGDKAPAAAADKVAATKGTGALPGGTLSRQQSTTVTIKAIDPAVPSVTVTTADGRTVTRKIADKKNLEGLKVGDKVDVTYTQAILAAVERPQPK